MMEQYKLYITGMPILIAIIAMVCINKSGLEINKRIHLGDINRRILILSTSLLAFYYDNTFMLVIYIIFELVIGYINERIAEMRLKNKDRIFDRLLEIIEEKA